MVTVPGREIYPQVRLVGKGFFSMKRPVSGERIEFLKDGKTLGIALTGGDGIGAIRYFTRKEGIDILQIRVLPSTVEAEEGKMIIGIWKLSKPLFLVRSEALTKEDKRFRVPFFQRKDEEKRKIRKYSSEVLKHIAQKAGIVYLIKDVLDTPSIKLWLKENDFPVSPVIESKKIKAVVSERGKSIRGIVVISKRGIEDLLDKGIRIYFLAEKDEIPESESDRGDIIYIKDWKELEQKLEF